MSYQVTFARNSTRNQTKFWFIASSALLIILLNTVGPVLNFDPELFSMANLAIAGISVITLIVLCIRKGDVFIKIENDEIEYFDFQENQLVTIPVADIQSVTTRFGELHLSTSERRYCIDMTVIRNENTRWEIKEIIKNMAPSEYRSLNMAG
ncbi:MAG TPA: hypothetical protein VGD22_20200 [Sphingobacteriaceae bacterium]